MGKSKTRLARHRHNNKKIQTKKIIKNNFIVGAPFGGIPIRHDTTVPIKISKINRIKIQKKAQDKNKGRVITMLKEIAWNTFKKTGNIDVYLEFLRIQDMEQKIGEIDGNNKN